MLESLLNEYGYPTLLIGTFPEGETSLILGDVAIGLAGFYFGKSVEAVPGDIEHYELEVLALNSAVVIPVWIISLYRRRKRVIK